MRLKQNLSREADLSPLEILLPKKEDGYEESGPDRLRLEMAERQAKLRSRQIAASSVRYLRDAGHSSSSILETDVARVVDALARGMVSQHDSPESFSREGAAEIIELFESKGGNWEAWELLAKALVSSAEHELSFEDFLAFEEKVTHLDRLLRQWRAAEGAAGVAASSSRSMAARILAFCRPEPEGGGGKDYEEELARSLNDFLKAFSDALKTGSLALVRHRLASAAAEILASKWEAANREWQFLFATIEHTLHQKLGPGQSYDLREWFLLLESFIPRLAFAGYLVSNSAEIARRVPEFGELSGIPVQPFLRAGAAEVLLGAAPDAAPPLLDWAVVHRRCLFSGADAKGFSAARRKLLDVINRDVERAWSDWLDSFLLRFARTLDWCERREATREACRKISEAAYANLKEALDAVQNNPRFPAQLQGLLEHATLAAGLFEDTRLASRHFRRWVVSNLALGASENGWGSVRTVTTALKTALRLHPEAASSLPNGVAELVEKIEPWLRETEEAVELWPRITLHGLQLERFISGTSCQRDSLWLIRRCLMEVISEGHRTAPGRVHKWMAREIVPFAPSSSLESFAANAKILAQALKEAVPEMGSRMVGMFAEVFEGVPRAVLQRRLWESSDSLGQGVAAALYESCGEYRDKAGAESQSLCARDTSIILRRVAASLDPDVEDRAEFVGAWWNNLVNLYLVTRTGGIFARQLQAITEQVASKFGEDPGGLVAGILRPVFETAGEGFQPSLPARLVFRTTHPAPPSTFLLEESEISDALRELDGKFRNWLESGLDKAAAYADKFFPELSGKNGLKSLGDLIHSGFRSQICGAGLFGVLDSAVLGRVASDAAGSRRAERFCAGLLYNTERLPRGEAALYRAAVGEWAAFFRNRAAGLTLREAAKNIAGFTAEHIHKVAPGLVESGAANPSQEKCARDFSYVLEALARAMTTEPPAAILLSIQRYIVQMVAPYTGYSRDIWRMMWQASAQAVEISDEAPSSKTLRSLFGSLEACGRHLDVAGPISKRINSGDSSVFSPNPAEEYGWRDFSNAVLALSCFEGGEFEKCSWLVAFGIPAPVRATAQERLPLLLSAWRKWFPALNMERIASAVHAVARHLENAANVRRISGNLQEILEGYASVVGAGGSRPLRALFLARSALAAAKLDAPAESSWGSPSGPLAALLFESSDRSFDINSPAFANALTNLIGPFLPDGHALPEVIATLRSALGSYPYDDALVPPAANGEMSEVCRRDLTWLGRRALHAARFQEGSCAVMRWLREDVEPHAGEHGAEVWLRLLQGCFTALEACAPAESPLRSLAGNCRELSPQWVLARSLNRHHKAWARELVESRRQEIGSSDPDKCSRDVAFALAALASCADGTSRYPNWNSWWEESVLPFLREETASVKGLLYGHLPEMLRRWLPEPIPSRASDLLK